MDPNLTVGPQLIMKSEHNHDNRRAQYDAGFGLAPTRSGYSAQVVTSIKLAHSVIGLGPKFRVGRCPPPSEVAAAMAAAAVVVVVAPTTASGDLVSLELHCGATHLRTASSRRLHHQEGQ